MFLICCNDQVFYIEKNKIKSDFSIEIITKKNKLIFKGLSKKFIKDMHESFKKGSESILWKDVFNEFRLEKNELIYLKDKNFISNLKSLAPIFLLKGKTYGAYKIDSHTKGVRLKLSLNKDWDLRNRYKLRKSLYIQRVKTQKRGLELLINKSLDLYIPSGPFLKNEVEVFKDLETVKSKAEFFQIRLYRKFGIEDSLRSSFCEVKDQFKKILGEEWRLEEGKCALKSPKSLLSPVVYSSTYGKQVLDLISNQYKSKYGGKLILDPQRALDLTNKLKTGDYTYYFSLEKASYKTPVLYDSFHSRGRYNTFKINDSVMDRLLRKSFEGYES